MSRALASAVNDAYYCVARAAGGSPSGQTGGEPAPVLGPPYPLDRGAAVLRFGGVLWAARSVRRQGVRPRLGVEHGGRVAVRARRWCALAAGPRHPPSCAWWSGRLAAVSHGDRALRQPDGPLLRRATAAPGRPDSLAA